MDNDLLKQIEENTRATKNATKAIASFFILSAASFLAAVGFGLLAGLGSLSLLVGQVVAGGMAIGGQIYVVLYSVIKLRKS